MDNNRWTVMLWRNKIPLLVGLLFWLIQLPYLVKGGLIVDDWGDIYYAYVGKGFWATYHSWFPLFSNRPLAPLPITLVTHCVMFHDWAYRLIHAFVWFSGLCIFSWVLARRFSKVVATVYFVFASLPVISPAFAFSPINQLLASLSLLCWSLSCWCLDQYLRTSRSAYYWLAYLLLLTGMLTYEVILPLLVWTLCYPLIAGRGARESHWVKALAGYVRSYILPLVLVCGGVLLWQKVIAPNMWVVYSRMQVQMNEEGLSVALWTAKTWAYALRYHLPFLLRKSCAYIPTGYTVFCAALVVSVLLFCVRREAGAHAPRNRFLPRLALLGVAGVTLLSCVILYMLSGVNASISAYESRGMSSTWMALSLCLAALLNCSRHVILLVGVAVLGVFCVHSFAIQRDNYCEAWQMQQKVMADLTSRAKGSGMKNGVILGDVPLYVKDSYNQEIVFCAPWDFGCQAAMRNPGVISGGTVFSRNYLAAKKVEVRGSELVYEGWWHEPVDNLWIYRFYVSGETGTLERVKTGANLAEIIKTAEN